MQSEDLENIFEENFILLSVNSIECTDVKNNNNKFGEGTLQEGSRSLDFLA